MMKFEEVVNKVATVEMDKDSHVGNIEDFENVLDFYLEAIKRDTFEQLLKESYPEEVALYGVVELWEAIREEIVNRVEVL